MSKPVRDFPFYTPATTVGPQIARVVTTDPELEEKTLGGILDENGARLRLFRQTADHDLLSCEIYARQGDDWIYQRKEGVKYVPPEEFKGDKIEIEGMPFWSVQTIGAAQADVLRKLLRRKT